MLALTVRHVHCRSFNGQDDAVLASSRLTVLVKLFEMINSDLVIFQAVHFPNQDCRVRLPESYQ